MLVLRSYYQCANPISLMNETMTFYLHFVHNKIQNGSLRVSHILSHDQLVNVLMKPSPQLHFDDLWSKISVQFILRGHNMIDSDKPNT